MGYGIFNDEGLIVGDFFDATEAGIYLSKMEDGEGCWVGSVCPSCLEREVGENDSACAECSEADDEEALACGICDGEMMVLGHLGNTEHRRCRNCGIETHTTEEGS